MDNAALNATMITLMENDRKKSAKKAKLNVLTNALASGEVSVTLTSDDIKQILDHRAPDGSIVLKLHLDL